jgi:hydroxypyruvate reductase
MALRFAMQCGESDVHALFASSDGVDGNSGAAGVYLRGIPWFDPDIAKRALHDSNSGEFVEEIGELIMIPPTGNNLRDLFLLARS